MAEMSEQTQGLTDMMKQLMDSFNDLKVNQIEMRDALREVQSRTEAVEAHAAEIERRTMSTPADPVAAPPPPQPATAPSLGEQGAGL
jgi:phosphoenolpyruvate carboxylase